jgi:hypothetical protein
MLFDFKYEEPPKKMYVACRFLGSALPTHADWSDHAVN